MAGQPQAILGVDYTPSAFSGTVPRRYPNFWELVIEELDSTRPPGKHRVRGGFSGYDAAWTAYNNFWTEVSGNHRRTLVLVQIWPPIGRGAEELSPYTLLDRRKAYQEGRL